MLAALAECSIQPTLCDPLVDRLDTGEPHEQNQTRSYRLDFQIFQNSLNGPKIGFLGPDFRQSPGSERSDAGKRNRNAKLGQLPTFNHLTVVRLPFLQAAIPLRNF